MRGKAVPQGVYSYSLWDIRINGSMFNHLLQITPENMMSPHNFCLWINRERAGWKYPKPEPFFSCTWRFAFKCIRKLNSWEIVLPVVFVDYFYFFNMLVK